MARRRKTDTRRIIHYIFENITGETLPRYEDVDRLKESFVLRTWIAGREDLEDIWQRARDTMEDIYIASKEHMRPESIEEIMEALKESIDTYIEWEGLPPEYRELNKELYRKTLEYFGIKPGESPLR